MKNVILYVRVSTDEQANRGYSIRDQEQKLLNYCQHNNYTVMGTFREDYSAKTFKRPEFKKLLEFCKKNKKDIHQLLFIKWDRFSRNTSESYQMIDVFNNLAIQVNAIEQPLDLSIPEQGLMLAVYLSMPEVENQRRSLNVIAGMRRAVKEGRYVGGPPKGYSSVLDSSKKPILTPNDDAKFIQEGFEMMSTGIYNQREVFKKIQSKGFNSCKSAFARILRNPVYYGVIFLKAYKLEKEQIVEGIHEQLITKELFNKVQDVLDNRNSKNAIKHKKVNKLFPLRGFLLCPDCDKLLTASISKGRSKFYTYYHCISPCNRRYKIEDAENWILNFLKDISMDNQVQLLFVEMIKEELNKGLTENSLGPKHYEKVKQLETKLIKLQDLYIEGEIEKEEYLQAKKRYEIILNELKSLETTNSDKKEIFDLYKNVAIKLINLDKHYTDADVEDKRKLIGSIFPNKLQFENNKVRTSDINPILLKISSLNNTSGTKKKRDKSKINDLSHVVTSMGFEPTRLSAPPPQGGKSTNFSTKPLNKKSHSILNDFL